MCSLFRNREADPASNIEPVPTVFPKITGADMRAAFIGTRLSGDFYDAVRVSPERVLFGLLDVSGRREDNRSVLLTAQEIFREYGAELFSRLDLNESTAMTELCLRLNQGMIELSSEVRPCPAFIACYHEVFGTLCYTNAGHTPGLLRDATGITELPSTGLPLGLFSHATSDAPTVAIEKGAALLLVSRGVVECESPKETAAENFSLDRVKQVFQTDSSTGAQALCVAILDAAGKFTAEAPACDDRTVLAMLRTA
jgi:sigma-B regulation protein RsbU (phosphoserine phosphatase)